MQTNPQQPLKASEAHWGSLDYVSSHFPADRVGVSCFHWQPSISTGASTSLEPVSRCVSQCMQGRRASRHSAELWPCLSTRSSISSLLLRIRTDGSWHQQLLQIIISLPQNCQAETTSGVKHWEILESMNFHVTSLGITNPQCSFLCSSMGSRKPLSKTLF